MNRPVEKHRRKFLAWLGRMLRAAFWVLVASPVLLFATYRAPRSRTVMFAPHEQTGCAFKDGVYLMGSGRDAVALSGCCTHLGCTVSYDARERTFHCPCHCSAYDASGKRLRGPARGDLARPHAELQADGTVHVTLLRT